MKILNFGSCNIDYVYSLDHIVAAGETETTASLSVFEGGKGLNQSVALARAGVKVFHAGCIGEGGDFLRRLLDRNGVDTSLLETVEEKNGHAIIQVSREGENSIFLYAGSNECVTREQIDRTLQNFDAGDLLILQNEISEPEYLVEAAYKRGMRIMLNPSPFNERIARLDFDRLSYLILNEVEARAVSGCESAEEALPWFRARYPRLAVMLTLGKKGCIYLDANVRLCHPVFRVQAVDTTAAGDTFTGYFAAGIAAGDDIQTVLRVASCAAALSVSRMGAAPSIPTKDEVLAALERLELMECNCVQDDLRRAMEQYLAEELSQASLAGLAARLGYTASYTGQLFRCVMGKSFSGEVTRRRLSRAAELLWEGKLPVGEIIRLVGYENESFFRAAFRKRYGMNPLEYRKQTGGKENR